MCAALVTGGCVAVAVAVARGHISLRADGGY